MIAADSNLLIYGLLPSDDRRHASAVNLLNQLMQQRRLFLPLQVIGESFHVLLRKGRVEPTTASRMLATYTSFATVEPYRHHDVLAAIKVVADHNLSFWDALIWAVCERCGIATLFTEDLQDGRTLGNVAFVDPFGARAASYL